MRGGPYSAIGLAGIFVPFYAGPVLAGWAAAPAPVVLLFAFFFLFYTVATRRIMLGSPADWARLALTALVQIGLVWLLVALGWGLARLTGPIPLPLPACVVLTGVAAVLGAWRYRGAAELDATLDQAIAALEEGTPFPDPGDDLAVPDQITNLLDQLATDPALLPEIEETLAARTDAETVATAVIKRTDHSPAHLMLALRLCARPGMDGLLNAADLADLADEALDAGTPELAATALRLLSVHPAGVPEKTRAALKSAAGEAA